MMNRHTEASTPMLYTKEEIDADMLVLVRPIS